MSVTPVIDQLETLAQCAVFACAVFGPVTAVGDIHGVDTLNYTKDEKLVRGKVASCYRLADISGWSHGLDGYITVSLQLLMLLSVSVVSVLSSFCVCVCVCVFHALATVRLCSHSVFKLFQSTFSLSGDLVPQSYRQPATVSS